MLKKIKGIMLSLGVFSLLSVPIMVPVAVYAAGTIQDCVTGGTDLSTNCGDANNATSGDTTNLDSILRLVINIFSIIVGFVAVVMIIVGGIKYITSGGDSGNISGAKNTIVYAIIGLIIVALAQVLVHFVLQKVATAGSTS